LNSLVVMEIALAVVLLTFAGLLTKSFAYLLHTDLGYRADGLLTFRMALPSSRYKNDRARVQFWDKLLPQLAALPGVVSAAASDGVPLGGTYDGTPVEVEGLTPARDWAEATTRDSTVTSDYFRTIGIPLRAGRAFNAGDTAEAEPVAMVNETFVRKLMHGASPLGKHVRLGQGKWLRVVGVIGDIRYQGPAQGVDAEAYLPFTQDVRSWFEFVALRTAVPEGGVFGGARDIVRRMDPGLAVTEVRSMRQSIDLATAMPRAMMALVVGFAIVTLGMATLGLAGVMAYTVSRRRREIGLRIALGARGSDVSRAVVGSAARLILTGSAIGVVCGFAGARGLESLLYGVRPHDAAAMAAAPVVLAAVALLASLGPARRAASVEPMAALRQE
jgi:putative ABC transport system permease protein